MTNTIDSKLSELEALATAPVEDLEAERLKRKQRLACGLRTMGRLHLAEGVPGHVTVRDPEHLDRFWVNPFGTNFIRRTATGRSFGRLILPSSKYCSHVGRII